MARPTHEYNLAPRDTAEPPPRADMRQLTPAFDRGEVVILEDRPCVGCGYNLKGLTIGAVCPECAQPITRLKARIPDDVVTNAPIGYVRILQAGFTLMAASAVGGLFVPLVVFTSPGFAPATALMVAMAWLAGVSIVCWPRPAPPPGRKRHSDWPILRIAVFVTQAAWPLAVIVGLSLAAAPPAPVALGATPAPTGLFGGVSIVTKIIAALAVLGIVPTMWLLANLSEWVNDDDRARRLKYASGLAAVALLLELFGATFRLPIGGPFGSLMILGLNVVPLIAVGVVLYNVWSIVQLAQTTAWAINTAKRQREREQALRERVERDRAAAQEELRAKEPFGGPIPPGARP